MQKNDFRGVLPALTTKMAADQEVDLAAVTGEVAFHSAAPWAPPRT